MKIESVIKKSFTVIGKEGSTREGNGFIKKLWEDANSHFSEISHLAKRDADGNLAGVWGAMSDMTRSFMPWDNFKEGLYLAGVECRDGTDEPEGWKRWVIPSYEYLRVERENDGTFSEMIAYLRERNIPLAGAVHDFTCPQTGRNYMFFPIRRMEN